MQLYKGWYFDDNFIYIITWFISLQIHFTSGSVKVTHSKCYTLQFPSRTQWIINLTLPDCFFHLSLWWQKKTVWWHSQYRVVSANHNFHDMLISKINTTLIYGHTVGCSALLSNGPIISKASWILINKCCVLMHSNSTLIIKLMYCCTSQYWLCHQTLFSATTKITGRKRSGNVRLMSHCVLKRSCGVQHLECVTFTDPLIKYHEAHPGFQ